MPHEAQLTDSSAPHAMQNEAVSGLPVWHFGHATEDAMQLDHCAIRAARRV